MIVKKILTVVTLLVQPVLYAQEDPGKNLFKSETSYQYALIEASRQKMIGNISEAINLYKLCINSNPECDVAYYELGTVYSALGENKKAEESLKKAFELKKNNYWYGIAYSELLNVNDNISGSLKVLRKMRKYNQDNLLTVNYKIADLYLRKGRLNKASKFLEEIENKYGVSELVSLKKVEVLKKQKKFGEAEKVMLNLIKNSDDVPEYLILLAEYYSETGDTLKAIDEYNRAFSIDSGNIFAITNLSELYSQKGDDDKAFYFLNQAFNNKQIPLKNKIQTVMYFNSNRELLKEKAVRIESLIISLNKQYTDNIDVLKVTYDFYNGLENHTKALEIVTRILDQKKDDFLIWQQALYNASMLEDYDQIIIIGQEALKYFPNKDEVYLFLGMAWFQKKSYEDALRILEEKYDTQKLKGSIKLQYLVFLSQSAYYMNFKDKAYRYFDELISLDPKNNFIKNNYSYYLALDSTNLELAKKLSYETISEEPDNSTFLDTYAWILFKLGVYDEARVYAEKAVKINNHDPDIIFHYAEILRLMDLDALAEKYYKLAEEKGYDKAIIKSKLDRLITY